MIARVITFLVCGAVLGLGAVGCGGSSPSASSTPTGAATAPQDTTSVPQTQSSTGTDTGAPSTDTQGSTDTGQASPPPPPPPPAVNGGGAEPLDPAAVAAATAAYQAYVSKQANSLVKRTTSFSSALQRGDPRSAVHLYPAMRIIYERITPVADRVRGGLDTEIAGLQGDVPNAQWSGVHKIEKLLFQNGTTVDTEKPGRNLVADTNELRGGAANLQADPSTIAAIAIELLDDASGAPLKGEEERWSLKDLNDVAGNMQGIGAAWKAIKPLVAARDPKLAAAVSRKYKDAHLVVESFKTSHGYRQTDELGPGDLAALKESFDKLAAQLEKVPPVLGA